MRQFCHQRITESSFQYRDIVFVVVAFFQIFTKRKTGCLATSGTLAAVFGFLVIDGQRSEEIRNCAFYKYIVGFDLNVA